MSIIKSSDKFKTISLLLVMCVYYVFVVYLHFETLFEGYLLEWMLIDIYMFYLVYCFLLNKAMYFSLFSAEPNERLFLRFYVFCFSILIIVAPFFLSFEY